MLSVKLALMEGPPADALGQLTIQLEHHPGAAPLLVLKARLDRDAARQANRALDDNAMAELSRAPNQLRHLDPAYIPMFHFQQGLAVLALVDGANRLDLAAKAFSGFRRTLSRCAEGEKLERETATDRRPNQPPGFHEWLQTGVNHRLFRELPQTEAVRLEDVPIIDQALSARPFEFEAIENAMIGRLAFAGI